MLWSCRSISTTRTSNVFDVIWNETVVPPQLALEEIHDERAEGADALARTFPIR